jgi:hypothetical protein
MRKYSVLRRCGYVSSSESRWQQWKYGLGVTAHDASGRATGFKPKEETKIAPCDQWLLSAHCECWSDE